MSFGESMFPVGFNQKIAKDDLIVKGKYRVPSWYLHGKTLEGSRSHVTKAKGHPLTGGAARPPWSHLSASFVWWSPTVFEDASRPLLKAV